jgi:hypothetical protein
LVENLSQMIKTLEELEKALLRERSAQATRDFRSSVRPIYAQRKSGANPMLAHAGSCILLKVDGHSILSTAAHILDARTASVPLFVGGPVGTHPVPIEGGVLRTTTAPQGNRHVDHLDCGFWKMPEEAVRALGAVEFLDASRISHNRARADRRYYMVMGYPLSRNKRAINHQARTIGNRLSRYSGSVVEIPELAAKLGVSGAEHLFLRFEKHAQAEDDSRTNAYDPTGFSGGPLLDLGEFTSEHAYTSDRTHRAALSGMLIEHHREHRAMVAVKIGSIVAGIMRSIGGP